MKLSVLLIGILFSRHTMAYRLGGESFLYIGKTVHIVDPYYEEDDGTRFPINVKASVNDWDFPELAYLCSMYTNTPPEQISADAEMGKKEGMVYDINEGFSINRSYLYPSVNKLTCLSSQFQSVPLGGKTTYSADGSMTVEFPTIEYNGKIYPIVLRHKRTDYICQLLGFQSFEAVSFSFVRTNQSIEFIDLFAIERAGPYLEFKTKTSGKWPLLVLSSITCRN